MKLEDANTILLVDGHNGIYTPKLLCDWYGDKIKGLTEEMREDLSSPENEYYWDTYTEVIDTMEINGDNGIPYTMFCLDGELFAMPTNEYNEINWDEENI